MGREAVVYVVDDEPDMRSALTRLFRTAGLEVETYPDAQAFLEGRREGSSGCLVLDMMMPGMTGLELQKRLSSRAIRMPVIFLTGTADVRMAVEAMRAGAADFLEKPFDNATLVERVRHALHLDGETRRRGLVRNEIEQRIASLTPREREVMDLVVAGSPTKQIAEELNLSTRTVEVHRANIMDKMEARTLADLVRVVLMARG